MTRPHKAQKHTADPNGTVTSQGTVVFEPNAFATVLEAENKKEKKEDDVSGLLSIAIHCLIPKRTTKPSLMLSCPHSLP